MPDDLCDWMPYGIRWQSSGPVVDWCRLGGRRFVEPWFDETVQNCPRDRRVTSADALIDLQAAPGLPPTGFIFHASRCGSTLMAQMLASVPRNIVVSEAGVIEAILAAARGASAAPETCTAWLRGVIGALGRPRHREQHYFIKFCSRAILDLPFVERAFPRVPWVFLYREPAEILGSYLRNRRPVLPPGLENSGLIEGDPATLSGMPPEEFWTRVLARNLEAAARFCNPRKSLLVNYRQLPDAAWEPTLSFFGVECRPEDIETMRAAAALNAKNRSMKFTDDSKRKRQAAIPARAWIDSLAMPHYERFESIRIALSTSETSGNA